MCSFFRYFLIFSQSIILGTGVGCASGVLVSEGEDLIENGELEEAIARYDEALLKRPAWPQGIEDENVALSTLREQLSLALNEQTIKALEERRWEDACRSAESAEYLDGVTPIGPSLQLMVPVLQELQQRFDEHLIDVELWGELEWILKGLEICKAPADMIENLLARFAVVMSITLDDFMDQLHKEDDLESSAPIWKALNRLELRLSSIQARLPVDLIDQWQTQIQRLREKHIYDALNQAQINGYDGLAWALANLVGDLDEAIRFAERSRDQTLLNVHIQQNVPDALVISPPLPNLTVFLDPQKPAKTQQSKDTSLDLEEHLHLLSELNLHIEEKRLGCQKSQIEVMKELRLIDHYEERPDPTWLKAIIKVEEAQTHFEARSANLAELKERLAQEQDPLVLERLTREVNRSVIEVSDAESQLSRLEQASEKLPKSVRSPIYVVFRYPVIEWTLACEMQWTVTQDLRLAKEEWSPLYAQTEWDIESWSSKVESKDQAHRAYPQQQIKPDPLHFPESETQLWQKARVLLSARLHQLLARRLKEVRQNLYEESQHPTALYHTYEEQLDRLATLALTSTDLDESDTFRALLMYALAQDPRWESPSNTLSLAMLNLGLRHDLVPNTDPQTFPHQ